ncbi:MAG: GDSL family lipase [Alphaproteobacteria bacterium]|nr:GDSL family lipase [Alphaproteobacteria bacterium]
MLSTLTSFLRLLRGDPRGWEFELRHFDAEDAAAPPEPGRVVFTGSSSIRFWETLEADMAPWPVLRRGFGGCKMADVRYHLERVCLRYAPSAVVLYAGDNDLGLLSRTTPAQVAEALADIERALHARAPEAPLLVLSIKPSPLRWRQWPRMQEANALLRAFAEATPRCHWVDVAQPMLGEGGRPRRELYARDGLHMSAEGYALWTGVVRATLEQALGRPG